MIATNFAPNESWDDAWVAAKLLFQPWRWFNGHEIKEVKKTIISLFNAPRLHISLFLTGRSALCHLLESFNLAKNSQVAVQAFTCEAVILPILANKLKPIYVDIEAKTFSMNPADLEKKISKRTKVVILQHTFGMTPLRRNKILNLVKKHQLLLIEDIAHGFQIPNSKFQILNSNLLLSFGRTKALSSVFGGAVVTADKKIAATLRQIEYRRRNLGYFTLFRLLIYKPLVCLVKATYDSGLGKLIHKIAMILKLIIPEISEKEKRGAFDINLDKAYPNALAILLKQQLKKFEQFQKQRALISSLYAKTFPFSHFPTFNQSLIRFPLLLENRDEIISKMRRQNIFLGKWYDQVVAPKELDLDKMKYKKGSCPVAENLCQKIINLPTTISKQEGELVIKTLNNVALI